MLQTVNKTPFLKKEKSQMKLAIQAAWKFKLSDKRDLTIWPYAHST